MDELEPITAAFDFIDAEGGTAIAAEVELFLGNGQCMTIKAGGSVSTALPLVAPFTHYEVVLDHDPPRFWHRFAGDKERLVYAKVPRLLIAHHAVRHGGVVKSTMIRTMQLSQVRRKAVKLPITTMEELAQVLSEIAERPVQADVLRW